MIYRYKAFDSENKIVESRINASSEKEVLLFLREKEYRPIKIFKEENLSRELRLKKIFNLDDIYILLYELYILNQSSLTIPKSFKILIPNYKSKKRKVLEKIYLDLNSAKPLSKAFEDSLVFPRFVVNMIKVAEESSSMELVLKNLSKYYLDKYKFNKKIRNAMIYPILVLMVSIFIVNYLVLNILPNFVEIFENSNANLPLATRILININNLISNNILYISLFTIFLILFIYLFSKSERGVRFFDNLKLKSGFYKLVINKEFVSTLKYLIDSKTKMSKSLEIVYDSFDNVIVKEEINKTLENLYKGVSVSNTLRNSKIFSPLMVSMIEIGENSNGIKNVLNSLNEYYNNEIEIKQQRFISLIEPILIIVLSIFVGFIVVAIALPIFDIVNY